MSRDKLLCPPAAKTLGPEVLGAPSATGARVCAWLRSLECASSAATRMRLWTCRAGWLVDLGGLRRELGSA
jgi:hypothetical protein